MTALKAYSVTTNHSDPSVIVFAMNANEAKKLARASDVADYCGWEWTDMRVKREPRADVHAAVVGPGLLPSTTAGARIMRELGWYECGGTIESCDKCGLHQWESVPESTLECIGEELLCQNCKPKPESVRPYDNGEPDVVPEGY